MNPSPGVPKSRGNRAGPLLCFSTPHPPTAEGPFPKRQPCSTSPCCEQYFLFSLKRFWVLFRVPPVHLCFTRKGRDSPVHLSPPVWFGPSKGPFEQTPPIGSFEATHEPLRSLDPFFLRDILLFADRLFTTAFWVTRMFFNSKRSFSPRLAPRFLRPFLISAVSSGFFIFPT